jgi:hypothetical protein
MSAPYSSFNLRCTDPIISLIINPNCEEIIGDLTEGQPYNNYCQSVLIPSCEYCTLDPWLLIWEMPQKNFELPLVGIGIENGVFVVRGKKHSSGRPGPWVWQDMPADHVYSWVIAGPEITRVGVLYIYIYIYIYICGSDHLALSN